ncbi:hypothetical protein ACVBEF_13595, partial [Glaciimonas sp. GG7]
NCNCNFKNNGNCGCACKVKNNYNVNRFIANLARKHITKKAAVFDVAVTVDLPRQGQRLCGALTALSI